MRISLGRRQLSAASSGQGAAELGDLPEWNLADLYPSMDAPELKRDIAKAVSDATAFESRWKGTLAVEAARAGEGRLGEALRAYEGLEELIGRIVSYAGLVYAGNTADPQRAKLYGDIQEKMTDASAHLLFFALELNLVDDAVVEKALASDAVFGHYRPWVLDLRKDKPFQLEDRVEQLFHEKSVTGRGAWNRLFDETMTDLRFDVDGEELTLEPALNKLQDADGEVRRVDRGEAHAQRPDARLVGREHGVQGGDVRGAALDAPQHLHLAVEVVVGQVRAADGAQIVHRGGFAQAALGGEAVVVHDLEVVPVVGPQEAQVHVGGQLGFPQGAAEVDPAAHRRRIHPFPPGGGHETLHLVHHCIPPR